MNIFIDTSVIYTDPFWKRSYAKELLHAAKAKRIFIYISDIVYGEVKYNYRKTILNEIDKLEKSHTVLNKYAYKEQKYRLPNVENILLEFEDFYKTLFAFTNIINVETKFGSLKEVLHNSINHKGPFFNNKAEFKDSVIWSNYYRYAKQNHIETLHLITNNKNDFIVEELKKDYEKLECYLTLEDFYKINREHLNIVNTKFQKWFLESGINENVIFDLITKNEKIIQATKNVILNEIASEKDFNIEDFSYKLRIATEDTNKIVKLDINSIRANKIKKLEIDVFKDHAIISCEFCMLQNGKLFLSDKDLLPKWNYYREYSIEISFSIDKNRTLGDINVSDYVTRSSSQSYPIV